MKVIILLGVGMSDETYSELGNRSPLQAAATPNMDLMARHGRVGLARTVPDGLPPGSDVANLSVFGYDPRSCYTGRSPLEAVSMGVGLGPEDVDVCGVNVDIVRQDGNHGSRSACRRRGVVGGRGRIVHGGHRDDNRRRGRTASTVADRVGEAGRAAIVGRRREHDVAAIERNAAGAGMADTRDGEAVAVDVAIIRQ